MAERGQLKLNLQRGASVTEFREFLSDLEAAYIAIWALPKWPAYRRRTSRAYLFDYVDMGLLPPVGMDEIGSSGFGIYPDDQLEISRITIQSPGWVELIGSLNPLQQLREYLKDRHERKKDKAWRSDAEKDRALLENQILQLQAEREQIGAIGEFSELLERIGFEPDDRQRILWERLGPSMMRLGRHQDTGLLGSQNDSVDKGGIDE